MRILREILLGVSAAFTTSLLVLGAITLAMTEGMVLPEPAPYPAPAQSQQGEVVSIGFVTPTSKPSKTPLLVTATALPLRPTCAPVPGWARYTIRVGDSLETLAQMYGLTPQQILDANCWEESFQLMVGYQMFLLIPTSTPTAALPTSSRTPTRTITSSRTPVPCVLRRTWSTYIIQPDDNLIRLATLFGTTVQELVKANCLASANVPLISGKTLLVPPGGPRYTATNPPPPSATNPPPSTATNTRVPTATPVPPTRTFTSTPTSTFTFTPTSTSTLTATPVTPTNTPTRTYTPTGTGTATNTSTPTATMTATKLGQ